VNGFTKVEPTSDEVAAYKATRDGFMPGIYRVRCIACGTRIWSSGLGIGSHNRACPGSAGAEQHDGPAAGSQP
jgi:hypothetical protein